ncbi:MAG: hypothetical protein RMA76_34735 [Deltaproteobacteria bacterium]|jgi:hypothetical protein
MARIERSAFANAPGVSISANRSSQGDVALKELKALKFSADLALPPDAAELRRTDLILGTPTQRDALRLPALGTLDAAACVDLVKDLADRDLGDAADAAPVREMQAVLQDLVRAAQLNRGRTTVRI